MMHKANVALFSEIRSQHWTQNEHQVGIYRTEQT